MYHRQTFVAFVHVPRPQCSNVMAGSSPSPSRCVAKLIRRNAQPPFPYFLEAKRRASSMWIDRALYDVSINFTGRVSSPSVISDKVGIDSPAWAIQSTAPATRLPFNRTENRKIDVVSLDAPLSI